VIDELKSLFGLAMPVQKAVVSCEKKLLWVVSYKKAESCLVKNRCKTIWGYQIIEFWNNVFNT
jgi:hypothetical protein